MMKKNRQALIVELIEQNCISTQEELLKKLLETGIDVTQATVSRDIKEMRIVKQSSASGEYKYCIPTAATDAKASKYHALFSESVLSTDCAMGICLVKCHVGTAQAACAAIDSMSLEDVVGTLAGDDTIFILCRDEAGALRTKTSLDRILD